MLHSCGHTETILTHSCCAESSRMQLTRIFNRVEARIAEFRYRKSVDTCNCRALSRYYFHLLQLRQAWTWRSSDAEILLKLSDVRHDSSQSSAHPKFQFRTTNHIKSRIHTHELSRIRIRDPTIQQSKTIRALISRAMRSVVVVVVVVVAVVVVLVLVVVVVAAAAAAAPSSGGGSSNTTESRRWWWQQHQ